MGVTEPIRGADISPQPGQDVKPFAAIVQEIDQGKLHALLGQMLHDLVSGVQDTGKKGTLTLTLTVETVKGNTETLMVTGAPAVKIPTNTTKASVFFVSPDGNLTREDPNQPALLPLRGLQGGKAMGE